MSNQLIEKVTEIAVPATSIGTGNATITAFSSTLTNEFLVVGSITVTSGSLTISDDGDGTLSGTGGSGTYDAGTGEISVTFSSAPANGAAINVAYSYYRDPKNKVIGISPFTATIRSENDTDHSIVIQSGDGTSWITEYSGIIKARGVQSLGVIPVNTQLRVASSGIGRLLSSPTNAI